MTHLGRLLIVVGCAIVVLGVLMLFSDKLPFRIGRLPGDIVIRGKNSTFYFPLVTCLLLSVILTLIGWLFTRR